MGAEIPDAEPLHAQPLPRFSPRALPLATGGVGCARYGVAGTLFGVLWQLAATSKPPIATKMSAATAQSSEAQPAATPTNKISLANDGLKLPAVHALSLPH